MVEPPPPRHIEARILGPELRAARGMEPLPLLRRISRISVWQSLGFRALLVAFLIGIALLGHWLDRDGLKDNLDGEISFIDIIYFTTVTITTVGYGDIVPVTPSARMFDAFVVTPIRLFVWLIFLGSAYSFVFKDSWDRMKTRMIAQGLHNHFVICGFGGGGSAAVRELLLQGVNPDQIVVIDPNPARIEAALAMGVTTIAGDSTHNATLEAAEIQRARAVLVSTGRDDTAALAVLSARQMNRTVPISVNVRAEENEDLLRQAGADSVVNPISMGGHLLARSATHPGAVDYLSDLAAADGRVELCERPAAPAEIGQPLQAITTGLGVRIVRAGRAIGYWEPEAASLQPGDSIVEILRCRPPAV